MADLRQLFDGNPQPMLVYQAETLLLLAVNDALCERYGYEREELAGQSILVLHLPEDHARVRAVLRPVQQGNVLGLRRVLSGLRLLRKDGSAVEIEAVGQPVEHEGQPARLVLIPDVADRHRAELAEQRLAAMVSRSRDIILFIAQDGRILEANLAAVRAYGHPREALLKMRIADLREPATAGEIRWQMASAVGEGILFETTHRRRDGRTFPVAVDSAGVEVGGERVLVSIIRDLTLSRAAQAELQRAEARIAELTREVRVLTQRLSQSK
jgi:PAS domain S-box-containing protein